MSSEVLGTVKVKLHSIETKKMDIWYICEQ